MLVIPRGATQAQGLAFAAENRDWIAHVLSDLPEAPDWQDGDVIDVLGQPWRLQVEEGRQRLSAQEGRLLVPVEAAPDRHMRLRRWLMSEARTHLSGLVRDAAQRLTALSEELQLRPINLTRIRLSSAATRWGSCSGRGTVSINWRLVMTPPDVAAYVAAHEVAHLAHMDHSPAFWSLNQTLHGQPIAPARQWLASNGGNLLSMWS
ncbi:MAG: SprT family zinc-dependent metalloprotease [Alphaproteobacteria bacterium]